LAPARLGQLEVEIEGFLRRSGRGQHLQLTGYQKSLSGSATLSGRGTMPSARRVVLGGDRYAPALASQSVTLLPGETDPVVVTIPYAVTSGSGTDLRIDGAYLTQATQRYDGSVALVAGRDAVLRVFALASQANAAKPAVRVRLYHGSALVQTYLVPASAAGVPPRG
jgi:hypothetical protein